MTPGGTYTFSFFARNNGGAGASYSVYDNTSYAEMVPPTSYFARIGSSSFTRLQVTFTVPAGCSTINVYPVRDSGAADVLLWGARLEAGSVATGYDGVLTDILVLSASSVQGGASAAGTLSLASPAPAGGAIVPLSSSDPTIAAVPSSVTVAAGATSATFAVTTATVVAATTVTISAIPPSAVSPAIAALQVTPAGALPPNPNLLSSAESIGAAPWQVNNDLAVTLGAAAAPDGSWRGSRAVSGGGNHTLLQQARVTAGTTYTFSFFARNNGGAGASYSVYDNSAYAEIVPPTSYLAQLNGSTFVRVRVTFTAPAGCSWVQVYPLV